MLTAYNGDGNVNSITAVNAETGNQTTQYLYGSTLATSGIASSLLKVAEVYPDSLGGNDQVTFTYNCQSELTTLTDQNGTVHAYAYDLLGRLIQDAITTVGAGVDTTVLLLATAYEVRGMVSGITSYNNPNIGFGSVVNDVQLQYNSFAQLSADYQSHGGAVNFGTSPSVQYGYANGSTNTIRPTTMTYPNGRVLNYNYGTSGSMSDALSRVGGFIDNDGVTQLANYFYLGVATVVEVLEPQPGLTFTLIGIAGGNDPVTGDIYRGLDQFGRVKDLIWTSTGGGSSSSSSSSGSGNVAERIEHGYDLTGNRLWRNELADPTAAHDELYEYDGLYRLKEMQRGTLNSNETAIVPMNFAQCWGLDATGNWQNFREDDTSSSTWNLVQTRSSNRVNEITNIASIAGPTWVTPTYNPAGNMTILPQPVAPGLNYNATYDAWNRLMTLSSGGSQVAGYQYDGLKRRTVKNTYTGGVVTQTRHQYYSAGWQVLEERIGSSTTPDRQFVWGLRYVDDLLLRDRNTTGGSTLNERFYGLQDPNWNLTAIVDITGTVQERYIYSAYGVPTVLTPAFGTRAATLFNWETLYAGYRWDSESGLYQVRNRVYQSQIGVWIQRDPRGLTSGLNLYQYVAGRAVTLTDYNGLGAVALAAAPLFLVPGAGQIVLGAVLVGAGIGMIGYGLGTIDWSDEKPVTGIRAIQVCAHVIKKTTQNAIDYVNQRTAEIAAALPPNPMCTFNFAWCLWGLACRNATALDFDYWYRWDREETSSQVPPKCVTCYRSCLLDKVWPFEQCPIGTGIGTPWIKKPGRSPKWIPGITLDAYPKMNNTGKWICRP